mgnify:CR=1 FL=1
MNILGFIPARSGSMGIKNKNMALLNKRPLIYYTLDIAKKIKRDVFPFVSTDSEKIRKKISLKIDGYNNPIKFFTK